MHCSQGLHSSCSRCRPVTGGRPQGGADPQDSAAGSEPAPYEIKQLDTLEELVQSYRLRYEVYADLGYLRHANTSKLEIDEYDAWAIPFGAFDATSRTMIGTLRLVTKQPQSDFSRLVQEVLELFADDSLAMQARAPRPHILPSIVSDKIHQALAAFNTKNFIVCELSRCVVGRNFRRSGVSRRLMELGLAQASFGGTALLIGSYLPEHLPMYAKYGYLKLPQTDLEMFDSVGQIAVAGVCRTDRLPQPTRSHVDELLRSMRMNTPEHSTAGSFSWRLQGTLGAGPCATGVVGLQWTSDS
jgi:predicted GNAT family N-acyltransferase